MNDNSPDILYHYCNLSTFLSIISNKTLWLSNIGKSNDKLELNWLNKVFVDMVIEVKNEFLNRKNLEKEKSNFDFFQKVESFAKYISKDILSECWALCFSENGDLLSQWRGYADDGKGVSIGFSSDFFEDAQTCNPQFKRYKSIEFGKVNYFDKNEAIEYLKGQYNFEKINNCHDEIELSLALNGLTLLTSIKSIFIKHHSFLEEKEWRMVTSWNKKRVSNELIKSMYESIPYNNFIFNKIDFVINNNNELVSHLEFKIPNLSKAIKKLLLGLNLTLV